MSDRIRKLEAQLERLEGEITAETGRLKSLLSNAADLLPQDKSYYLVGIQTGPIVKAYHLTCNGVGVQGEGPVSIGEFIDSAMRFANFPKRKIEVLNDLENHLQAIRSMIGFQQAV